MFSIQKTTITQKSLNTSSVYCVLKAKKAFKALRGIVKNQEVKKMKVENLNGYANQFLIIGDGQKTFQSYNSTIAVLSWINGNPYLRVFTDWDYSKTTMRHFKRFINEETSFNYEDSKQWRLEMKNNPQIEEVL